MAKVAEQGSQVSTEWVSVAPVINGTSASAAKTALLVQQRQTYRAKNENQCLQETILSVNASVMGEKPKNCHQPAAVSSLNTGQ